MFHTKIKRGESHQEKAFQAGNIIIKLLGKNGNLSYKNLKKENFTKRDPVTCCFSIQPKRDPGDDDQKDARAVHLSSHFYKNLHNIITILCQQRYYDVNGIISS